MALTLLAIFILAATAATVGTTVYRQRRSIRGYYQGRRDQLTGSINTDRMNDSDYLNGAVTEYLDTYRHADCGVCDTTGATFRNGICTSCAYWRSQIGEPGALVIDGDLYFIGTEPTRTDLLANPKLYGCYGTGFRVRSSDGTETVTHNLGHCGTIPAALRPADNAAFIGEPEHIPTPRVAPHNCFDHLDYIGGHYPYECVYTNCYLRYDHGEVIAYVTARAIKSLNEEGR
jgi:hypothetical protein